MVSLLSSRLRFFHAAVVLSLAIGVTGLGLVTTTATADTSPPAGLPATVSADPLPTWQINGVVWAQVIVGNTVYVTGSFTKARPPGVAAGGAGEIAANNIFAYDITTGNRVATFSHSLNGQGLAIAASPDGSTVYVGGDFTTVDGVAHSHLAAFSTATGQLISSFDPTLGNKVEAIATTSSTVYAGGNFFNANGKSRRRLAAFTTTGTLLPWAPTADDGEVEAMVMAPDNSRVIVAGGFTTLNKVSANGMGSLDATSGAVLPWAANTALRDGGSGSSIDTLSTDGNQIYGGGYAFKTGRFEGTFAANPYTGAVIWANDCHGDTYGTAPVAGVLYSVSHAHSCQWIGGYPNSNPWTINMHHTLAFTTAPSTGFNSGPDDYGWDYRAYHDSTLLHWFPELKIGTFTGINQAAWSVAANSKYVVLGGEFPKVNGKAQQGLTRFAISSVAPNKVGPVKAPNAPAPTAKATGASVRVTWQAPYDMDNRTLTYNVYRSGTTLPVYTTKADSTFWNYPMMGFSDTVPAGSYTYTVKVSDPFGNTLTLAKTAPATATQIAMPKFTGDVLRDGASDFWRLGDAGHIAADSAGSDPAALHPGVTMGAAGAIKGDTGKGSVFDGSPNGFAAGGVQKPAPSSLTVEAWIKTTTTRGGLVLGFGSSRTANSSVVDRSLYLDDAGRLVFGVRGNAPAIVASPRTYNDGRWHQVVGTLDPSTGMTLYVDGQQVATNASARAGAAFAGFWRIGGDSLSGWPDAPTSGYFGGAIADVSVYPSALSSFAVHQQYVDSGR